MELNLSRIDYFHVGSSFPGCVKVLPGPTQEKSQDKVVIGNRDGLVQVVGWKKHEPVYTCRVPISGPIRSLQLGGAIGTSKDKIFVASGTTVRGFTKKGKMFLEFDTKLAEEIKYMHVMGGHLLVSGTNVCNHFEDCQDSGFYISDETINLIMVPPMDKVKAFVPILGCQDRTLRILERGKLKFRVNLPSIPSSVELLNGDGGESGWEVVFGSVEGKFGLVTLSPNDGEVVWMMESETSAAITCMDFYDITADGNKELICGFDDGTIQVYILDQSKHHSPQHLLIFNQSCHESITGIQGTIFGNSGFEEILVLTYSGWVLGFSTETSDKRVHVEEGTLTISDEAKQKLMRLKGEIDELELRVSRERDKYEKGAHGDSSGLSAIPFFPINDKMVLNREDASYLLTIEVESPIDTILIQSDVPIDLLDVEKNSAVVSFSQCDPDSGNFLLTTFRCQANTTRIEVRLRTIEGQHGRIQTYITPRIQPKSCQVRSFTIHPLSLHVRSHSFDPNRPYNTLHLGGSFSFAEIHSWLSNCIPEMPDRVPSGEEASFTFVSSFLDTLLQCSYKKGEGNFKSDNVSTISILKEFLSKEASKKRINLQIQYDFNEESVLHTLQLIRPKLEGYLTLAKQVALIEPLKEIQTHDPEVEEVLSSEYKYILENGDKLKSLLKRQPSYLNRLSGMITDLYIDKHKYSGVHVKNRIPQLMEVLQRQDFNQLVDFFQTPTTSGPNRN